MPQDPFLTDQIKLEPGSGQTLTISRDAATGSLHFVDNVVTGGINLNQLAGIGSISNVLVVGQSGVGSHYTSIQDAIDVVPMAASASNPYFILVMPGVYTETLNIVRDGVYLVGLGNPTIESALEATPDAPGADHTIIISVLVTTPLDVLIQGFTITNAHANKACIRITGGAGSTLLSGDGLSLVGCDLRANSAAGNYTVWATAAGEITSTSCFLRGPNALALLQLQEMTRTWWRHCTIQNGIVHRYDTANDQPAGGGGLLHLHGCSDLASFSGLTPAINIDCDGAGGTYMHNCSVVSGGRIQYSGDRSHYAVNCHLSEVSLLETVSLDAPGSHYESLTAANTNAEFTTPLTAGTADFAAATTAAVAFDIPQADADYTVFIEVPSQPVNDETPWITAKAATGFTINFNTAQTMTVSWKAIRL